MKSWVRIGSELEEVREGGRKGFVWELKGQKTWLMGKADVVLCALLLHLKCNPSLLQGLSLVHPTKLSLWPGEMPWTASGRPSDTP